MLDGVDKAVNAALLMIIPAFAALVLAALYVATKAINDVGRKIDEAEEQRKLRTTEIIDTVKNGPANALARRVIIGEDMHNDLKERYGHGRENADMGATSTTRQSEGYGNIQPTDEEPYTGGDAGQSGRSYTSGDKQPVSKEGYIP